MLDLAPAAAEVTRLLDGVPDDALRAPTPCPEYPVGALLDHFMGLTLAFTWAAEKSAAEHGPSAPGSGDTDQLDPDWRTLLPQRLAGLAQAWSKPEAWTGETQAGGITLPAEQHGAFALDELVMHGWDLARATGQEFRADGASTAAVLALTAESAKPQNAAQREGLFGPVVQIAPGATDLEQALAYAGRNPNWAPPRE